MTSGVDGVESEADLGLGGDEPGVSVLLLNTFVNFADIRPPREGRDISANVGSYLQIVDILSQMAGCYFVTERRRCLSRRRWSE